MGVSSSSGGVVVMADALRATMATIATMAMAARLVTAMVFVGNETKENWFYFGIFLSLFFLSICRF